MSISYLTALAISLCLEIWLIILLVKRGVRHHFPVFFIFAFYTLLLTIARLATLYDYRAYFFVYWWTDSVLAVLSLAALHEVVRWTFEGFYRLWWFRTLYYGTIILAPAIAIRNAAISSPIPGHPGMGMLVNLDLAFNFMCGGIVGLFYLLQRALAVEFRRYAYGIVVGFGICALGSMVGYVLFTGFGTKVEFLTKNLAPVAYILGAAVWVASFARPEPKEKDWTPPMSPEQMLEEVRGYLRALDILKGFLRRRR